MKFIDSTEIHIRAGSGGKGLVSFKSGHGAPKMGADGGDGGHGGNVCLIGKEGLNTLGSVRYHQMYAAENGAPGGPNGRTGRCGEDLLISVPVGTIARDAETGAVLAEVMNADESTCIAQGGRRGLGNMRFLRSTHQAPEESTPGTPGEERTIKLELKLLADVGFAGLPNAGKSTLLGAITAAKPKIGDYPFTTLQPQLGVVEVDGEHYERETFVAADIPGLIEGASDGKGLGLKFLRHLERTKVVAYVIDCFMNEFTWRAQFEILRQELEAFNSDLAAKPGVVILSKMDLESMWPEYHQEVLPYFENLGWPVYSISAATKLGLKDLKRGLLDYINAQAEPQMPESFADLSDYQLITPTPNSEQPQRS